MSSISEVFGAIKAGIQADPSVAKKINGVYLFKIGDQQWTVDCKVGDVKEGAPAKADCTLTLAEPDFLGMVAGKLNGQQLFMSGKLKIAGNMALAMKLDQVVKSAKSAAPAAAPAPAPAAKSVSAPAALQTGGFQSDAIFQTIERRVAADKAGVINKVKGVYLFVVNGPNGAQKKWTVDLKQTGNITPDAVGKADCTITVGDADFVNMASGKANPQQLFMGGKLKIAGNMSLAMKLDSVIKSEKAAL
eukprot:TRINITY_DN807_c0_g1_i1.p1 TRINITY_DN807_c0_g1~~TRINITY_DN807_c0_g1_i1.p1  ORF type:complete len:267 (-),score=125.26 TRINITY_DN807_c0_g1_i1:67-807(-)